MYYVRKVINLFRFFNKPQSITTQFVKWYTTVFLLVIIAISVSVAATVSVYLFRSVKQEVATVKDVMEQAEITNPEADWGLFMEQSIYPRYSEYMMKIEIPNNGKTIYSRDWEDFYDEDEMVAEQDLFFDFPLLGSTYWHEDEGMFYKEVFTLSSGENVTIYASLEDITEFIFLLINVLIIVGITAIIVGAILIVLITRKNTRPIAQLTDSVNDIDFKKELGKGIFVPEGPKEITNLAQNINDLMLELDSYIENEKSFVANASHELRTPIAAIHGHVNLIKRRGKQHPEIVDSSVETIYQESIRMEKLISQLLAMAKLENFEVEKSTIHISQIVHEVVKMYREKGESFTLTTNIADNLYVLGNEEQIRQMCIILLDNALKYTDEQGTVTVTLQQQVGSIVLKIADNGIGIPKEEQEKIFHRFYRVDKARSRETGGTGLGLTMVKQFVEQHNGTIHVISQLGEGSEFTIILPCK